VQAVAEIKPKKQYAKRKTAVVHRDIAGRIAARIPADQDPAVILSQYLSDARTSDIAASYGVTRPALNMWLLDRAEEGWRKAQVARAVSRKESAEDEIDTAQDPLTLARAREKLRGAQWELERLYSRLFGQKQEVRLEVNVNLADRLVKARERVIEPDAIKQQVAAQQDTIIDVVPTQPDIAK
jgi:hypothetical protein